jgi:hypothetical protein
MVKYDDREFKISGKANKFIKACQIASERKSNRQFKI